MMFCLIIRLEEGSEWIGCVFVRGLAWEIP